jgi:hypothetical protein
MAANIRDPRSNLKERKPVLIDRIDDFNSEIFAAIILPKEDGVITVSDDKLVSFCFSFYLNIKQNKCFQSSK